MLCMQQAIAIPAPHLITSSVLSYFEDVPPTIFQSPSSAIPAIQSPSSAIPAKSSTARCAGTHGSGLAISSSALCPLLNRAKLAYKSAASKKSRELSKETTTCWLDAMVTAMRMQGIGRMTYDTSDDPIRLQSKTVSHHRCFRY